MDLKFRLGRKKIRQFLNKIGLIFFVELIKKSKIKFPFKVHSIISFNDQRCFSIQKKLARFMIIVALALPRFLLFGEFQEREWKLQNFRKFFWNFY